MDKKFGKRLKEARRDKELSQMKLGELSGLHYTQIGRYERGDAYPSLEVLKKLAEALEVSIDHLIEGGPENVAQNQIHDKDLLNQFKQVQNLAEHDKYVVKTFLDAFLLKKQIQKMAK